MIILKLSISRSAALPAAFAAVSARLFIDLALDAGPIHNGLWISALLGALPALPYLLCLEAVPLRGPVRPMFEAVLLVITALDAAQLLATVTRASGSLTLEHVPAFVLGLPAALAVLWCVWRGGDAIGYAAVLWTRFFPILMLVVMLLQMRHYHPHWLLPLLGNGWEDIVRSGVRASGRFVPATAILLVSEADKCDKPRRSFAGVAAAAAVSAALLVLRLMMAPTGLADMPWASRLDALLTNGRAPLYLQLPMILAFFIAALQLLACECFAASALLQRLFAGIDGRACGTAVVLACAGGALSAYLPVAMAYIAPWIFIVAALMLSVAILLQRLFRGGERLCEG